MLGSATSLDLAVNCARDFVTWQQLRWAAIIILIGVPTIGFRLVVGVLILEYIWDVFEHKALAEGIRQNSAFTTNRVGNKNSTYRRRPDHSGWVELQELHVNQISASLQSKSVTVAGALP